MDTIEFLREANRLKATARTGWIVEGVKDPESVAEHSFGTALLALVLSHARKDIDRAKAVKMALTHDLAESRIGDVLVDWKVDYHKTRGREIPGKNHGISAAEKHELEKEAMASLTAQIAGGREILDLWMEFEEGKTAEAVFVRSVDKLEMLLQAVEYEKAQGVDLGHWLRGQQNQPKDPHVRELLSEILRQRKK